MPKKKIENEANTEEIILNAAYILLAEKGYANVSTREIAAAAGVALSQLSYYYKTKEHLLLAIIKLSCEKISSELKDILSLEKSGEENLGLFVDYFKTLSSEQPDLMKLVADFMGQAIWNKEVAKFIARLFDSVKYMVRTYILKTGKKDKFKGLPSNYVAELIVYGVFGISLHNILGPESEKELDVAFISSVIFGSENIIKS